MYTSLSQTKKVSVAYFSMEFGLEESIKTYAGGLGILSGDIIKEAADQGLDFVGISILYKNGYLKQEIDENGIQQEVPDVWDYQNILTNTGKSIMFPLKDQIVHAEIWKYEYEGITGHKVPVFFLNTDIDSNTQEIRYVSYNLYTPYQETRLKQELVLGLGGVYALKELGYGVMSNYHLNESHAAFGIIALKEMIPTDYKNHIVFTTHTPEQHGHIIYDYQTLANVLTSDQMEGIKDEFENGLIHLSKYCFRNAKFSNCVSKRHMEVTSKMFPEFKLDYVTNGVHVRTWAGSATKHLFDQFLTGWEKNVQILQRFKDVPKDEILNMHKQNKTDFAEYLDQKHNLKFDPNVFTIGFGRRVDIYKRTELVLKHIDVLQEVADKHEGIQVVMSGKAYFNYAPAEGIIADILNYSHKDLGKLKVFFIKNYDMNTSAMMVKGCDIWLNNPIKPKEASGTSGMKASVNGLPNFSTIDGWWVEGWHEGVTGWSIGNDSPHPDSEEVEVFDIYKKLDDLIIPAFEDKTKWADLIANAISLNGVKFSATRMLSEYMEKAYLN